MDDVRRERNDAVEIAEPAPPVEEKELSSTEIGKLRDQAPMAEFALR